MTPTSKSRNKSSKTAGVLVTPPGDTQGAVSALLNLRSQNGTPTVSSTVDSASTTGNHYATRGVKNKSRTVRPEGTGSQQEGNMEAGDHATQKTKKGRKNYDGSTSTEAPVDQNLGNVDTPKTAKIKALRAAIAENSLKTIGPKGASKVAGKNLFHVNLSESSDDELPSETNGEIDLSQRDIIIPFASHDGQAMESIILSGAAVFGAMTHKAPLHSIPEGMIICLAIPDSQSDRSDASKMAYEFMQVGRAVGSHQRALVHVATSRPACDFNLSAKQTPTMFLAPINTWYFTMGEQALHELAVMSHIENGYQIGGKCQQIPIVLTDNQTATDFYGTNAITFQRSQGAIHGRPSIGSSADTAISNSALTRGATGQVAWSEDVHFKERDSIPKQDAHLYYEVAFDSIKRSKELMRANPDIRVDKTFQQSKTADSLANKGMNRTVTEIISVSPHDATRRLQTELLGRYFRNKRTYMPLCILIKLASSWSFPLGSQGIFYFMDLTTEYGLTQASMQIRLFIQPKAAECLTSVTNEFINMAASDRKTIMSRFNITSARDAMLNYVYAIAMVHDMKFKFQRAMIGSVNRLFTYIETHTLGNHTAKNVEFIKSSMILLADAWETHRMDMSMRGKSEIHDILTGLESLPDLSSSGLIAQTKKQLQYEDGQSTIRLLLTEIRTDKSPFNSKNDHADTTTKSDKSDRDKKDKKDRKDKKDKKDPIAGSLLSSRDTDDTKVDSNSNPLFCLHYLSKKGCPNPGSCPRKHTLPNSRQQLAKLKGLLIRRNWPLSDAFQIASSKSAEETN
jgi:hypothetical protein